jgi:3-oxoacyl-[acyl-carrier protein] reductase
MALELADKGAKLALVDLNQEDLDQTAGLCMEKGVEARTYTANVAEEAAVEKLFTDIVRDFSSINGLVNNAGITRDGLFIKAKDGQVVGKMSMEQWNQVISVTKAGVEAMAVTWAKELARYGIRAASIAPGYIGTEMVMSMKPEALEKIAAGIPAKRLGKPEEIARTVSFILENDYVNGRCLEIDGALRI